MDIACSLYNLTGTVIQDKTLVGVQGFNDVQFKFPSVAPGIYLLKVQYGNEIVNTKIVVN